ncbi:MAG: hypothetical protein JNL13_00945 [Chitinophagaceae bacterium]|nr:hypothetical protein [Chitinophagaceae bacterium]
MIQKIPAQGVLLLLLLLSSCVKESKHVTNILPSPISHGAASSRLYPLQLRNFWLYTITDYDSTGKETRSSFLQRVIDKAAFGRDTFYKVNGAGDVFYRSPSDSLTLITDTSGNITPRFQYNKQAGTIRKIGSLAFTSSIANYYSFYGLITYNGDPKRPCLLIITEDEVNHVIKWKTNKYVQPGVGVIATEFFQLKSDTAAVKEYVLTQKWELKDYYLYP